MCIRWHWFFMRCLLDETRFPRSEDIWMAKRLRSRRNSARLHQSARTLELFPVLQTSSEMCLRPEIGRVIRAALTPDHQARPFSDAAAFLAAFRSALGGSGNVRLETPTELARRLTNLALSNFEAGYFNESDALLEEVMLMHSDDSRFPIICWWGVRSYLRSSGCWSQDDMTRPVRWRRKPFVVVNVDQAVLPWRLFAGSKTLDWQGIMNSWQRTSRVMNEFGIELSIVLRCLVTSSINERCWISDVARRWWSLSSN